MAGQETGLIGMEMEMTEKRKIPVVIPAYEPDEKLLGLLGELKKEGIAPVIVVDDGSGPKYRKLFDRAEKEFGAKVLRHAVNLGKGRALKTAFNECLQSSGEIIGCVTADSDGQHTAASIRKCMEAMREHPLALVLGCRNFDQKDVPARSAFGNKLTRQVLQYLAGVSVSDSQTGLRGIPRGLMARLMNVSGERFEFETNMLLEAKAASVPILEVKIPTIYLEKNKRSHFRPVQDSIRIYGMFGKFLFSSLSSSVLDLLLFSLFCALFRGRTLLYADYIVLSTVAARVLSAVYNFGINYRVVFQSGAAVWKSALKYFLLAALQMGCSAFLVSLIYSFTGGWEIAVKIPVDVALFFLSFWIQREAVYR